LRKATALRVRGKIVRRIFFRQPWRARNVGVLWEEKPTTPYPRIMKTTPIKIALLLPVAVGLATLQSGCAGTATQESTGEFVDDSTITARVKAAFVQDQNIKANDISVTTHKGIVQLSGFVDSDRQKTRAEEIAEGIPGVKSVQNEIAVK
jgi:hyperosmotically inducible protein